MQTDSRGPSAGAAAGQGRSPTICSRLQRAFQARPALRPLLRLTGHPQDGGAVPAGGAPATTHGSVPPPIVLPAHAPAPSHAGKAPTPSAPVAHGHGGAPPPIVLPAHAPAPSHAGKAPKPVTHGGAPPPIVLPAHAPGASPAGKAPKATAPPAGKVPTSATTTVSATANKYAEKVAGWMPAPAKAGDKPATKVPATSTPTTVSTTANKVAEKVAGWMPTPAPPSGVTTGRPSADAKAEDKVQQTKGKVRVRSRVRKALSSSK